MIPMLNPSKHLNSTNPIVIIGMHRSGTTLLVDILEKLGVFTGWRMGKNKEAFYYQRWNEWLMRRAGGAWDNPEAINWLFSKHQNTDKTIEMICDNIRKSTNGFNYIEYTGLNCLRQSAKIQQWGWKDPRNAYLIPLWKKIYPKMKVINVIRNGVDVALSLNKRANEATGSIYADPYSKTPIKRKLINLMLPREQFILGSVRCLSLTESYRLWEEYTKAADKNVNNMEPEYTISLRYEDFLSEPTKTIKDLSRFIGINPSDAAIEAVTLGIDKNRRFAFVNNEKGLELYESIKNTEIMKKHGYDNINNKP
jgi:hypothetical protein